MSELGNLIDNEFSVGVIGILNLKLDGICEMAAGSMDAGEYEEMADELSGLLVDASREFFIQGFLRGIAAVKGGAV